MMRQMFRTVLMLTSFPALAHGQEAPACPSGTVVPDFGYTWVSCPDCLGARIGGGRVTTVFLSPPTLHGIREDGPAAGRLRDGDRLLAIDDFPIETAGGMARHDVWTPGRTLTLTVERAGIRHNVRIAPLPICALPSARQRTATAIAPRLQGSGWLGMGLACAGCRARRTDDSLALWELSPGPAIAELTPNGPAALAGLAVGDTIVAIDGHDVASDAAGRRLRLLRVGDAIVLRYRRAGAVRSVTLVAVARP